MNRMNRRKGKENRPKPKNLVDYKELERNVREEIANEFWNQKKQEKGRK